MTCSCMSISREVIIWVLHRCGKVHLFHWFHCKAWKYISSDSSFKQCCKLTSNRFFSKAKLRYLFFLLCFRVIKNTWFFLFCFRAYHTCCCAEKKHLKMSSGSILWHGENWSHWGRSSENWVRDNAVQLVVQNFQNCCRMKVKKEEVGLAVALLKYSAIYILSQLAACQYMQVRNADINWNWNQIMFSKEILLTPFPNVWKLMYGNMHLF